MISIQQAWEILRQIDHETNPETVSIFNARGRIAFHDIIAEHDSPPFDQSRYDGYAVGLPATDTHFYRIIQSPPLTAGSKTRHSLSIGEALPIMTGAIPPKGTYLIIPREFCRVEGNRLTLTQISSSDNRQMILRRGSDFKKGDIYLKKGEIINPIHIAFLALDGRAGIPVHQLPIINVLSVGDELSEISTRHLGESRIRNSHPALIQALISPFGVVTNRDHETDDIGRIIKKLDEMLGSDCQVVVTTGGMGKGVKDLTRKAILKMGSSPLFEGIDAIPIGTFSCYRFESKIIFSLPGGLLGVLLLIKLFIVPFIKKLQGRSLPGETGPFRKARLKGEIRDTSRRFHKSGRKKAIKFVKSHMWKDNDELMVTPLDNDSLLRLNSFIVMNTEEINTHDVLIFPLWDEQNG